MEKKRPGTSNCRLSFFKNVFNYIFRISAPKVSLPLSSSVQPSSAQKKNFFFNFSNPVWWLLWLARGTPLYNIKELVVEWTNISMHVRPLIFTSFNLYVYYIHFYSTSENTLIYLVVLFLCCPATTRTFPIRCRPVVGRTILYYTRCVGIISHDQNKVVFPSFSPDARRIST